MSRHLRLTCSALLFILRRRNSATFLLDDAAKPEIEFLAVARTTLIRLSTDMSEGLKLYCWTFYRGSNLLHRAAAARQMYSTGSDVRYIRSSLSAFSPHPSPNCYRGVKKCEIWPRFRHHSSLSRTHFETKQRIGTEVASLMHRWWNSVLSKSGAVWFTPSEE